MKCEGCGAGLGEQVARCPYCGLRLLDLDSFEVEASTLLRTLDERLEKGINSRTDRSLFSAFFAWLLSGPLAFILLGQLTDVGVVGRGAASLLMMAPGFLLFGWFTISRQARAEEALWQESVAAELRGFVERKSLSSSELLVLAKRLLGEESRLAKRIARGDLGA